MVKLSTLGCLAAGQVSDTSKQANGYATNWFENFMKKSFDEKIRTREDDNEVIFFAHQ